FFLKVISRGKVVQFATVKRVSEKRQSLNIKITPDMVPSARLLVYYVLHGEEKAELVADSVWINVKAKCVNNLKVDISTLNSQYKPKDKLELRVSTKEESLVAFSAVDTALYDLKSNDKDPLKKVLQHVERSDLGCGRGGGKNNADVLDRAGLTFITNANAKASSAEGACSDIVRQKRSPVQAQMFEAKAKTYGSCKNYCISGTRSSPTLETCEDRSRRLPFRPNIAEHMKKWCQRAFLECCEFAMNLRKENADRIILSRGAIDFLLDVMPSQIRSYFPESWLWEEHTSKSGSVSITKNLPDSLTTWEVKAVGVFSEGICVSDEKVQVSQDISVDIPLPYSMIRGEQIELRGSVYNQRSSKTRFSVTLTATEGVCVFRGTQQVKQGKPNENKGHIEGRSVALVTFYIMALEAGTHTLTFTLTTEWGAESVVKKLKVVPEGIRLEIQSGGRIDPNGVFGTSMRKLEFKKFIPPNIVPKSTVDRILTVNGEVLGELLSIINNPEGLKQLTNMPRGTAEMELMSLLPIYYVYHYLDKTEKWDILGKESAASEKELKRKMQAGITSMMSYKLKYEHGFSMWSNKDKSASTWVTALIVKTFADMHEYVSLESEVLINCIYWLIKNRQNDDGSFFEKSQSNPLKLMLSRADVTEKTVFLTSFVMIGIKNALKVPNVNIQAFKNSLDHATEYLSSKSKKIESLYVRAIASYALTLVDINSMPAVDLYEKIKQQAQVKGNPATIRFWEDSKSNKDSLKPSGATAKALCLCPTVYVLLNVLVRGDSTYAKPILNWLTQDQRYGGGFLSTQDSILTLEALTKYSILASQATLDMVVDIEYKTKGDISRIKLTQQNPVAKPIVVIKNDDIIIKTAMSSGVSFAKLRTVYYGITESNENCQFNISIDIHDRVPYSDDPMLLSQRIVACAKYKPHENAIETESGLTVMEINLPTGVTPVQEDLDMYQNGLESQISNYEILGDKVILQIDSIPSKDFYCVGFRIQEEFETGMSRSSVFRVYEFNYQGSTCMKFYHKQSRKLLRLCEGDQCQCMAAECCNFKSTIDPTITAEQRKSDMCKESMKYVFKVLIESSEASGDFVTYKAKVKAVLKKEQTDDLKTDSEIDFVKKATCNETNFEVGKQYLVMTSESMKIKVDRAYKYTFPLDSHAWVDWWPLESDCRNDACKQYAGVLDDFEFDFILSGCEVK
ncbi:hypothetical protein PO909_025482, partial [Leuciscus waleckii]